jgi:hypothetical protein
MTSRTENARKRKQTTTTPEVIVCSDDGHSKSKRRRVSTDAAAPTAASLQVDTPVPTETSTTANAASTEQEETYKSVGKMIQDLSSHDNVNIKAALDALNNAFMKIKNKRESFVTAGGCHALDQLLKNCLDKAIDRIPECDQVTKLNQLTELKTLRQSLTVITNLTYHHNESEVGIAAIGGVEAVVKIMKTFPKCQTLQERACGALTNLTSCSIGKANAIECGGIEVVIAAVKNHLDSVLVCQNACRTLVNIVNGSKENTDLLITLGGTTVVAKVRTKWLGTDLVKIQVRMLAKLIASEVNAWADEE